MRNDLQYRGWRGLPSSVVGGRVFDDVVATILIIIMALVAVQWALRQNDCTEWTSSGHEAACVTYEPAPS